MTKTIPRGRAGSVHPNQLKRSDPANMNTHLDEIRRRLGLKNNTEAIGEAIAVLLLITDGGRRTYFVEDDAKKLIKIELG